MLDNHDDVNDISFLLVGKASWRVVEHDLVAGDLYRTKVIPQNSGTFIDFDLDHPPNLMSDLTFEQ